MCRIENNAITCAAHPVKRAHVGDEVVMPKGGAALGEAKLRVAEGDQFLGNVSHIPRREELTFFYVNRTTRLGSGTQQIRLPAEERRDLQHVDPLPDNLSFSRGMDIGCHRNLQLAPDLRENIETVAHASSAKRADRSSVRLVVGGFENEINIFRRARLSNPPRHAPDKFLRLNDARAENEDGPFTANRHFPDAQWFCFGHEYLRNAGAQEFKESLPAFLFSGLNLFSLYQKRRMARRAREKLGRPLRAFARDTAATNRRVNSRSQMTQGYA